MYEKKTDLAKYRFLNVHKNWGTVKFIKIFLTILNLFYEIATIT